MKPTRITRLLRLEAQDPDTRWQDTRGLAALLEYARTHPPAPWEGDLDEEPTSGLARLLQEARQWTPERGDRAC